MRQRTTQRGRTWPKTQEEDLKHRRADRAKLQLKAVLALPMCLFLAVLGAWRFADGLWGDAPVWDLLVSLGTVLFGTLFGRFVIMKLVEASRRDVATADPSLPRAADLPPHDPRRRYPRWLRWSVLSLELPVCFAALVTAVLGSALLSLHVAQCPGLGVFGRPLVYQCMQIGFAAYLCFRIRVAQLRHAVTGR